MEIVRIIVFYFCRGYTIDVVFKELCQYNMTGKGGIGMAKQMVLGMFAFMREVISERVIRDLRKQTHLLPDNFRPLCRGSAAVHVPG